MTIKVLIATYVIATELTREKVFLRLLAAPRISRIWKALIGLHPKHTPSTPLDYMKWLCRSVQVRLLKLGVFEELAGFKKLLIIELCSIGAINIPFIYLCVIREVFLKLFFVVVYLSNLLALRLYSFYFWRWSYYRTIFLLVESLALWEIIPPQ